VHFRLAERLRTEPLFFSTARLLDDRPFFASETTFSAAGRLLADDPLSLEIVSLKSFNLFCRSPNLSMAGLF